LKKVEEVQDLIDEHQLPIEILPGQEVRIYGDLLKEFSEGKLLTAAGTSNYILIEFPSNHVPEYAKELFIIFNWKGFNLFWFTLREY
jgi:protein-tyrosine phosphatase